MMLISQGIVVGSAAATDDVGILSDVGTTTNIIDIEVANTTSSDSQIWVEPYESEVVDYGPEVVACEVVPVVGEVTVCAETDNESSLSNLTLDDVVPADYSVIDSNTESLESTGLITVQGRIVYENVVTKAVSAPALPYSAHDYPANFNPEDDYDWPIYGRPDATSVWIFFSRIDIEIVHDSLRILDASGLVAWQASTSYYVDLWVEIEGNMATIQLESDGSIQYWGFEVTKFAMDQNQYLGVSGATVEIWDYDYFGDDLLASVTTDSQGVFTAAGISNDDPEAGTQDVYVKVRSTSDQAELHNVGAYEYTIVTNVSYNVPDGTTDYGNLRSSDADNPAWIVYSNLMDCWNTFKSGGPSYETPQIEAIWTFGHDADYAWGCPDGSHVDYDPLSLHQGEIHLDSEDGENPHAILHECGHVVMYRVYDEWIPSETGIHYYNTNIPEAEAWSEGWANFVPAAVGLYTGKGDRYHDLGYGWPVGAFYDMEASEGLLNDDYPGSSSDWPGGDTNEATVSYALYDIYDTVDDGTDNFDGTLYRVWAVLDDRRITDFPDYFDCFREHYDYATSFITNCHGAIKQGSRGTINYDPILFYDDFTDGNIADWTKVESGGDVTVDSSLGNLSAPCMKIYKHEGTEASSSHMFPTQGGDFVVEAKVRTPTPTGYLYFMVMLGSEYGVHLTIKSGELQYWDTSTWKSIGVKCLVDTWYLVTLNIHAATGYYDIYVDGLLKKSNALFYGGVSEQKFLNVVKFQAGYSSQIYKTLYVDEVVVRGGSALFIDQFRDDLDDWTKDSSGGPVSWDLTKGSCAKPSMNLYKQTVAYGTSAKHTFSGKADGSVFLEARVMVNTTAEYKWCYVNLYSGSSIESYLVLRDGYIKYYSGGTWYSTTFSYSANTWFKIGLNVDLESGKYDIYANGAKVASYKPLYTNTGSIDNVYLQAGCYNDLYGVTLWVDDIVVTYR